jgi:hypothetical protein
MGAGGPRPGYAVHSSLGRYHTGGSGRCGCPNVLTDSHFTELRIQFDSRRAVSRRAGNDRVVRYRGQVASSGRHRTRSLVFQSTPVQWPTQVSSGT